MTTGQMKMHRRAIEFDDICLESLRPGFLIANQLDITFQQLTVGLAMGTGEAWDE